LVSGGGRIATSVGGSLLGIGGDIVVIDDPHNVTDVESEAERETVKNWWAEISSTRLNDPQQSAIVVVKQRLHEEDVSGLILSGEDAGEWTHLSLPMRHDTQRHCITVLKLDKNGKPEEVFEDPRTEEGELMWPERFGEKEVTALETSLGPYLASGRLQQSPAPKGGGLIQRDWFQLYEPKDGKSFPTFEYIIASLDSAFTAREENDPSAAVVLGIFRHEEIGQNRIMLIHAWQKFLPFSADRKLIEMRPSEINNITPMVGGFGSVGYHMWVQRTQQHWGLLEHLMYTCKRYRVDKLLIESKASGISASQEISARYGRQNWAVQLVNPKGDKIARVLSIQPILSSGLVFAPNRDFAELVINQACMFPKGKRDDLVDALSQGLRYLRDCGLAQGDEEVKAQEQEEATWRSGKFRPRRALYPC
jgi:predicted phage terminase large subunit-like protein